MIPNEISNVIDVLLIESNPDDAQRIIGELKRHRLANKLFHVMDGEAAMAFLNTTLKNKDEPGSSNLPELILLDIQMPNSGGVDVLKKIRSDEKLRGVPVVILTCSNQDPSIQTCYDLGATSYIVKPLNLEKFSEAIYSLGFYWLLLNKPPT